MKLTACLRVTSLATVLSCATLSYAQKPAKSDEKGTAKSEKGTSKDDKATSKDEKGTTKTETIGSTQVTEKDHASADDTPMPPGGPPPDVKVPEEVEVAKNAGVGSELAYASKSVVEVGGVLALRHQSETTDFRISPSLGYFFADNVELTLFPELTITHIGGSDGENGQTDWGVGVVAEPSYHLPFNDRLLAFAGLGVGVKFAEDPSVDLLFRPRVGLDVLVGRSGILKPAAFMDVGVHDGLSAGGLEAGFTVMW